MKHDDRDEQLTREIIASLDASLDELDDVTVQRLKKARARSLAQMHLVARPGAVRSGKQKWILSVAAGFALLAMIPIAWQHMGRASYEQDVEMALQDMPGSSELPMTSEEMDDLDMLIALEDSDV